MAAPFLDIRDALRYKSFFSLALVVLLQHIAFGVAETLGIYMTTFFWEVPHGMLFWWGAAMFTGLFIGFRMWRKISVRVEKKKVYIIGSIGWLLGFAIPYLLKILEFWPDKESIFYIPLYVGTTGFLAHLFLAGPVIMTGSMLGDISDLDELETGKRREGVIFGAESLAAKMFTGLGPVVAGLIITFAGIEPGMDVENMVVPHDTIVALGLGQGVTVSVLFIVSILLLRMYDLTGEKHKEIFNKLEERKANQTK